MGMELPGRDHRRQPDVPGGERGSTSRRSPCHCRRPRVEIERVETGIDAAVVDHDVELSIGTLPAGTVVGQILELDPQVPRRPPVPGRRGVLGGDPRHPALGRRHRRRLLFVPGRRSKDSRGLQLDLTVDHGPVPGLRGLGWRPPPRGDGPRSAGAAVRARRRPAGVLATARRCRARRPRATA